MDFAKEKTQLIPKTTVENNILLAEFLDMLTTDSEGNIKEDVNGFKFHSDWNWLMLVVEKIESFPATMVLISSRTIIINAHDKYKNELKTFKEDVDIGKIKTTYNTCVEFVKWYNKNK